MKKVFCVVLSVIMMACFFSGCKKKRNVENLSCKNIVDTLRKAYGTSYTPNVSIPDEVLNTDFELNLADMKDYYGEMPQIGLQPDRIVVVKANDGKAKSVAESFEQAKTIFLKDELQYTNSSKVESAVILQEGDFVCFFMLGDDYAGTDLGSGSDKEKAFYEKQEQIGVTAWHNIFYDN